MAQTVSIRAAEPSDAATVVALLGKLAAFEDASAHLHLTEAVFRRDAFGPNRRFEALLAECDDRIAGMVTLVQTYSSWQGAPAMLVHDLFVDVWARNRGAGRSLLAAAAKLACELGCCRLDVNVLTSNTPARVFYQTLGFTPLPSWMPYRLAAEDMARLAVEGQPVGSR